MKTKSRKEKLLPEFEKLAKETTGEEIIKIPIDDNSRSEEEIEMLLTWASSLLPIKPIERVVKNGIKIERTIIEEKEYTEVVEVKNGFVKLKTEYMRREKRIRYNGKCLHIVTGIDKN
ncbi:hypothetical protein ENUP19_0137G0007 [Entamoeba nuttalli]|uniref:Uncharacterized protein n=1 Tax=Entamoeba nuttalli TaxID=412467 RepID=A0ABQ0DK58_9EUKA